MVDHAAIDTTSAGRGDRNRAVGEQRQRPKVNVVTRTMYSNIHVTSYLPSPRFRKRPLFFCRSSSTWNYHGVTELDCYTVPRIFPSPWPPELRSSSMGSFEVW
jgi:hypothetical protein